MKTAKKVLSVILSVILIVGTIAVGASAYLEPANETIEWSLKAEVLDAEGAAQALAANVEFAQGGLTVPKPNQTTLQKNDVNAYKALTSHTYYDKNDVIEVKPGQVVWVTAHVKTNEDCFLSTVQTYVFYSANMFVSTVYKATNSHVLNSDSLWMSLAGDDYNGSCWGNQNATGRKKMATAQGLPESSYMSLDTCAFHEYEIQSSPDSVKVYEETDEGLLYNSLDEDFAALPFYVSPDAEVGTTGQVKIMRDSKSYVASCYDGDPLTEKTLIYATDENNFLIDDAILNFKVVGDAPALDYNRIDTAIASVPADLSGYTSATAAAVTTALAAANKAKVEATTQEELDTAAAALEEAVKGLEEEVVLDYARLNTAIASVPADLSGYTTSTAAAVTAALEAAKGTFTTQPAIDDAAAALENAVAALAEKANMTSLTDAIASTASVVRANYTPESLKVLDDAVAAGQALINNANEVSDQAAVNDAAEAIIDAKLALKPLGANYDAVETAKNRYNAMNKAEYTNASKAIVDAAIAAVQYGLPITEQAIVDGYAAAINEAIDNLVGLADIKALDTAYKAANAANKDDYASDVWTNIQNYKTEASKYLYTLEQIPATEQGKIDALVANINTALANKLGEADYSGVTAAIASIPADLTLYTDASVKALNDAVNAVVYGLKSDKQEIVDGYAADIRAAINPGLVYKAADLTELNAAIAKAATYNAALYTPETYAAVTEAVNAAEALKAQAPDITRKDDVAAAAAAIETAIGKLEFVGADFSALKAKLDEADAIVRANYTDDSLEAFDAALAPAYEMYKNAANYDISDQPEINAMVVTATNAFGLLKLRDADYTAADAAMTRAAGYTHNTWYPADLWNAFQAAKSALQSSINKKLPITQQQVVDDLVANLVNAMDALDAGILDGDYVMLNKQLAAAAALNEKDYTADSWAALQAEIAKVETGLKMDRQDDIDAWMMAIFNARKALKAAPAADYSAVEAAIAAFEKLDAKLYTDASVAAVEAAIDEVDYTLNENYQDVVDAYAAAINEAVGKLELKPVSANYAALEKALEDAKQYNQDDYTVDTWAVLAAAVSAGKQVPADLLEADQKIIDDAAAAIVAAIKGLEEKAPVVPTGKVLEVNYTQSAYATKTYSFKVEGRQIAVRFVQADKTDSTITLSRSRAGMDIKHYDAAGNEVSDMSRDIAYEIWTTELKVQPADYIVIAKDATAGWESLDLGLEKTVKLSAVDKDVNTFEAATEVVNAGEKLDLTVVTGADVIKVQILVDDAEIGPATFDAPTYGTLDGNGHCTYNVYTKLAAGDHTLTVRIKTADGWEKTTETITVTAVK